MRTQVVPTLKSVGRPSRLEYPFAPVAASADLILIAIDDLGRRQALKRQRKLEQGMGTHQGFARQREDVLPRCDGQHTIEVLGGVRSRVGHLQFAEAHATRSKLLPGARMKMRRRGHYKLPGRIDLLANTRREMV